MPQTCVSESLEKFHGGQEHDELLGRPQRSHTDAMLKILSRLSIRAIAEEVGIGEMTQARIPSRRSEFKPSRPFFTIAPVSLFEERPERSSSWTAFPALAEPYVIRKHGFVTRVHSQQLPLTYKTFLGVFFLFLFEVLLHDQLRRGKMTYTN